MDLFLLKITNLEETKYVTANGFFTINTSILYCVSNQMKLNMVNNSFFITIDGCCNYNTFNDHFSTPGI